jgi:hypothetical protein
LFAFHFFHFSLTPATLPHCRTATAQKQYWLTPWPEGQSITYLLPSHFVVTSRPLLLIIIIRRSLVVVVAVFVLVVVIFEKKGTTKRRL